MNHDGHRPFLSQPTSTTTTTTTHVDDVNNTTRLSLSYQYRLISSTTTSPVVPAATTDTTTTTTTTTDDDWLGREDDDLFPNGCLFSPDGSCVLTSRSNRLELYNTPCITSGSSSQSPSSQSSSSSLPTTRKWNPALVYQTPDTVRCYDWYPYMNSNDPSSCCFVSCSRDIPTVNLWDAYTAQYSRATYRPTNRLDEGEAPTCLKFVEQAKYLVMGGFTTDRMIQIFDIHRPGKTPTLTLKLGETRRSNDGQKGLVSSLDYDTDKGLLAVGTYSPGSIYLYDLRTYSKSPVHEIVVDSVGGSGSGSGGVGTYCISGHGKNIAKKKKNKRKKIPKSKRRLPEHDQHHQQQQQKHQQPQTSTEQCNIRLRKQTEVVDNNNNHHPQDYDANQMINDDGNNINVTTPKLTKATTATTETTLDGGDNRTTFFFKQEREDDDDDGTMTMHTHTHYDYDYNNYLQRAKQQWYHTRTRYGVTQLKFFNPSAMGNSTNNSSDQQQYGSYYLLSTSRRSNLILQYDLRMLTSTTPYSSYHKHPTVVCSYDISNNTNQRISFDTIYHHHESHSHHHNVNDDKTSLSPSSRSSSSGCWRIWSGGCDGYVRSYPLLLGSDGLDGGDSTSVVGNDTNQNDCWKYKFSIDDGRRSTTSTSNSNCCVNGVSLHSNPHTGDTLLAVALGNRTFTSPDHHWTMEDDDSSSSSSDSEQEGDSDHHDHSSSTTNNSMLHKAIRHGSLQVHRLESLSSSSVDMA